MWPGFERERCVAFSPVDPLQGCEAEICRLLLFSVTLCAPHPPTHSENRCLPPKTTLIQIKLNEVCADNPCVFQLLNTPHPHSRTSASGPYPLAELSSCHTHSPWWRQQPAPPLTRGPAVTLCVFESEWVFYCKFLPFWTTEFLPFHFTWLWINAFLPKNVF